MLLLWFAIYNNTHIGFSRTCFYNTNKCWDQTQIAILIHLTPCYSSTALIRSTLVFVMFFKVIREIEFCLTILKYMCALFPHEKCSDKKRTNCSKHRTCMYCTCHQLSLLYTVKTFSNQTQSLPFQSVLQLFMKELHLCTQPKTCKLQ